MNTKPYLFKTQRVINPFNFSYSQRRTSFLLFTFFILLFSSYVFAQEKNKKDFINDKPRHNKTNTTQSAAMPNSPQATGDTVSVKDNAGNVLITVTDEGNAGSIKLNDAGAVSSNINKLYNNGGSLYWNGSQLSTGGSGGADSINQLADAKYDGESLFLGAGAGGNDDGSNGNTAVGKSSLYYNTTGYRNTANGYSSLYYNTTGHSNTANGYYALYSNIYGKWNTANGYYAFKSNTTGNNNVGLGCFADYNNETGSKNTIIGFEAGKGTSAHSKSGNLFLGYQAGYHETSDNKLYINNDSSSSPLIWGDFAVDSIIINGNFHVTGNITSDGAGVGADSINQLADAKYDGSSLFLGARAGVNDDAGASDGIKNYNTGFGEYALFSNTSGDQNTAIGYDALSFNTTGKRNTAIGTSTLYSNTTGKKNTAIGGLALKENTTGNYNTANGTFALIGNTTGNYNVGIGNSANYNNRKGSKNTILGFEAGRGTATHNKSGNVFLGYKAGYYETGDNKLYIQNDSSSSPLIWGDFYNDSVKINGEFHVTNNSVVSGKLGVGTLNPSDKVTIIAAATGEVGLRVKIGTATKFKVEENGGVAIGINSSSTPVNGLYVHGNIENQGGVLHTSDRRFKKNIINIPNALEKLNKINGVFYYWRTKEFSDRNFSNDKQIGVIAQDVEKVFSELVNTDSEGYKSVNYSKLTPVLIEAIKTQDKRIKILENENKKLRNQFVKNTNLENKVMLLEQALNNIIKNKSQINISSK